MKLYYSPGACSLAAHIAANEAGLKVDLAKVDLKAHQLEDGSDYYKVNPRGYVPALKLDDGYLLTEANVVVQYIADQKPEADLLPKAGTTDRWKAVQWLAFIATELHKNFGPLFDKTTPEATQAKQKEKIGKRLKEVDAHLNGKDYMLGSKFSVVDAYAFTIINWSNFLGIDLKAYPALSAYMARVAARPKVQQTLVQEGLAKAA